MRNPVPAGAAGRRARRRRADAARHEPRPARARAGPALRAEPLSGQRPDLHARRIAFGRAGRPAALLGVSQIAGRARPAAATSPSPGCAAPASPATAGTPTSVPLNEESEAYDLEVLDGAGAVLRTVAGLPAPSWTYPAAAADRRFRRARRPPTRSTSTSSPCSTAAGRCATRTVHVVAVWGVIEVGQAGSEICQPAKAISLVLVSRHKMAYGISGGRLSNGSWDGTDKDRKCRRLRVRTMKPRLPAVAAMMRSASPGARPAARA